MTVYSHNFLSPPPPTIYLGQFSGFWKKTIRKTYKTHSMYLTKPCLYKPKFISVAYIVFLWSQIFFQVCFNIFFKIFFVYPSSLGENGAKSRKNEKNAIFWTLKMLNVKYCCSVFQLRVTMVTMAARPVILVIGRWGMARCLEINSKRGLPSLLLNALKNA